jgi:hypothetical protein
LRLCVSKDIVGSSDCGSFLKLGEGIHVKILTFIPTGNLAQFPIRWDIEPLQGFSDGIKVRTVP